MGCAGSKKDVIVEEEVGNKKIMKEEKLKVKMEEPEDEIFVVNEGKSLTKSRLDEITEDKLGASRGELSKSRLDEIVEDKLGAIRGEDRKEERKSGEEDLGMEFRGDVQIKSMYLGQEEKAYEEDGLVKAKTGRVEFEKHPHEFDFSFIEEEKKEDKEDDILTDQILKEINDAN